MPQFTSAIEARGVSKQFGAVRANEDISFAVREGEIHALVGENGAGKSTLMNLLYGIYQPDTGEILVKDTPVKMKSPAAAIALGIGMVHQHFMLVPPLSVAENLVLGSEPVKPLGILDIGKAREAVRRLSEAYAFNLDPEQSVGSLSVGLQQRVEILKLLYRNADILILDEPTAILTPAEVEELFGILRKLKTEGKTVVFISHKVREIMALSDRVTVMRRGKVVATVDTASTESADLTRMMIGKDLPVPIAKTSVGSSKEPALSVDRLCCRNAGGVENLKSVSFQIHRGEVLGVAAIEGNGQTELVEVLTGLRMRSSGEIRISGKVFKPGSAEVPLAHIPEDRLKHGLVHEFTLEENFILGRQREPRYSAWYGVRGTVVKSETAGAVTEFSVYPPDPKRIARELSGGNQQKVVVARELSKNAEVILACHPTRGLDVGASGFVHNALLQERNKGKAVLLVSADLTELLSLADRVVVLYGGAIAATLPAAGTSEYELGMFMTGTRKQEPNA